MKRLETFKFWIISLLIISNLTTGCTLGSPAEEYLNQGVTNYEAGDYEQAIADYNKALELDPDFALAYHNRGYAYADLGDLEQAIADYNKALELDPNFADAYHNRGYAYYISGDYEQAIMNYNKVIELDPDFIDAYYNWGNAYHSAFIAAYLKQEVTYADSADDLKQVIRDFERYLELAPDDAPERKTAINIIEGLKSELGK